MYYKAVRQLTIRNQYHLSTDDRYELSSDHETFTRLTLA
jgi:hypothetical protein